MLVWRPAIVASMLPQDKRQSNKASPLVLDYSSSKWYGCDVSAQYAPIHVWIRLWKNSQTRRMDGRMNTGQPAQSGSLFTCLWGWGLGLWELYIPVNIPVNIPAVCQPMCQRICQPIFQPTFQLIFSRMPANMPVNLPICQSICEPVGKSMCHSI